MKRREFIVAVAASALPLVARAQQPSQIRRIGVLMGFPEGDTLAQSYVAAMRQKLAGLGWVENRNIQIVHRWGGGDPEKTRAFAKELVGMSPSVIVTSTNQATETMRQETQTIPIVFASLGDPVGSGLVASMNRPGGNVTGFPAFVETMGGKWLELMKEVAPRVTRIGFIHHPGVAPHRGLVRAAQAAAVPLKIDLLPLPVHNADEITAAITAFASGGYGGMVTGSHAVTYSNRDLLIRLAAQHRLPSLFADPLFADSGALLSYGSDQAEMFLGAASYVDQILKGSKPAEMPVQLPTKFNFIINLKTAEVIGLTIPPAMLARADRVIE
jgi:putative ABC transport system substrate-binding protein